MITVRPRPERVRAGASTVYRAGSAGAAGAQRKGTGRKGSSSTIDVVEMCNVLSTINCKSLVSQLLFRKEFIQDLHRLVVARHLGRLHAVASCLIRTDAGLQEHARGRGMTALPAPARTMKWRVAVSVPIRWIEAVINQELRDFGAALKASTARMSSKARFRCGRTKARPHSRAFGANARTRAWACTRHSPRSTCPRRPQAAA